MADSVAESARSWPRTGADRGVYGTAKAAGCSRVPWLTQTCNAQARILYDQVADDSGFVQYRKVL
jgi:hypothetical protein